MASLAVKAEPRAWTDAGSVLDSPADPLQVGSHRHGGAELDNRA